MAGPLWRVPPGSNLRRFEWAAHHYKGMSNFASLDVLDFDHRITAVTSEGVTGDGPRAPGRESTLYDRATLAGPPGLRLLEIERAAHHKQGISDSLQLVLLDSTTERQQSRLYVYTQDISNILNQRSIREQRRGFVAHPPLVPPVQAGVIPFGAQVVPQQ